MSYLNHSLNESPIIHGTAGATIANPAMLAVKFSSGKFVLPSAGDPVVGIAVASAEAVDSGDGMDVQIKDICYWMGGDVINAGSELATNSAGKAIPAQAGTFIVGMALEDGIDGKPVKVQIIKAGYKTGGSITPITLAACADVVITANQLADGQVLTYDASAHKWVNEAIPAIGLGDLSDVELTEPFSDNDAIAYDATATKFINQAQV